MAQDHYAALFAKLSEHGFNSREFVRQLVERGLQELVDAGLAAHIGADPHERTPKRTNRRNGRRKRTLTTQAGDIAIDLPKLREGSWFPEFLERTPPPGRPGPVRSRDDRLDRRSVHPQGRQAG